MPEAQNTNPSTDDMGFLQDLLTSQPPEHSGIRRAKKLRSLHEQRSLALGGYRFRTIVDRILVRTERMLVLAVMGFFLFWLYDGYGRDWLYRLRNPPQQVVQWEQIQPGTSAADLDRALGQNLPFVERSGAPPPRPPDYLVPAQSFSVNVPTQLLQESLTEAAAAPLSELVNSRPVQMYIPAIQLHSSVIEVFLENGVWQVADYAVGYHHGTAAPGSGNTVMAGHAGFRGGVFARLGELTPGTDIYIETAHTRFHYQVTRVWSVWPHDVEVMYPTSQAQVTLITCTAWDTQRLVVIAELVDQAPLSAHVGGGESRGSP